MAQHEIIGQVLPDLYKAVGNMNDDVRYVFSTDAAVDLPKFRASLKLFYRNAVPITGAVCCFYSFPPSRLITLFRWQQCQSLFSKIRET